MGSILGGGDSGNEAVAALAQRRLKVTVEDLQTGQEASVFVDLFLDDAANIRTSTWRAVQTALTAMGILKAKDERQPHVG